MKLRLLGGYRQLAVNFGFGVEVGDAELPITITDLNYVFGVDICYGCKWLAFERILPILSRQQHD